MITAKVKAADKSFRIYRPNETLEDICNSNGANIVRTMIPCFPENEVFRFSYVYGINVRTPRVNKILPFSTAYIYKKSRKPGKGKGKIVDNLGIKPELIKLKVPAFTDKYKIREVFLYADIKPGARGGITTTNDIVILSLTTDYELKLEEFNELKEDIARSDAFFMMQVNALGIKERAYLWLTSEDYNVNTGGDALSNIIAISDDYDAIAKHILPHRLDFIDLLFLIKARYLFDTEVSQRATAIASAKAAIMSRNMSHNLGSHVMAYLKQHLNSVQDMMRDNVLASLFTSEDDISTNEGLQKWCKRCESIIVDQREGLSEVALPFLVGLGKFISYLQERQDFIATIATDYIPYFSTVNFKDFIYDELNPDLRYERHKDRIGLQPDNILLGNIARSEGLARITNPTINKHMSDIIIKYRSFDGKPVYDEFGNPKSEDEVVDVDKKINDLEDMRDFMIHLPGGVVGRQAIFSIVENIIRNAAKHGKWGSDSDKNLELTFDRFYLDDINEDTIKRDYVPDGDDTFYSFLKKYYAAASDINDLCIVTVTDNMSFERKGSKLADCTSLLAIRDALIEAYIDKSSVEMLQTNKGIKEMRISAAWMRGMIDDVKMNPLYITNSFNNENDPEDFWIDKNDFWSKDVSCPQWIGTAPVLMVRACAETPDEDYHLQYVFCLPNPKDVAIVFSSKVWKDWGLNAIKECSKRDEIKRHLSRLSWGIYSVEDFLKSDNKSYEFIILDNDISTKDSNRIRMVSPNRVYTQDDIKSVINISSDIVKGSKRALTASFTKKVKIDLFKHLCSFNPAVDFITISDQKTLARVPLLPDIPKNVLVFDGTMKGRYLYRTHNETETLFSEYLDAVSGDDNSVFVEGITGNNSTDRLVRNDIIDELWLYKHLHAIKTTVAIFDERIFSKVYKKDESDIVLRPLDEMQAMYYDSLDDSDSRKEAILNTKNYNELGKLLGVNLNQTYGDYLAIAYEKKGVSIFNIVKSEHGLDIYGYNGYVRFEQSENTVSDKSKQVKYYAIIEKLGDIRRVNGRIRIVLKKNAKKYDYISIHQGLLDKIYEQFGIKRDAFAKHQFTQSFYTTFCKDSGKILYYDEDIVDKKNNKPLPVYYLPNLRIHSGRSKPSFADMPQHQPFIQYAAIEHAIMDCKYSLIELLDFARYE